ncbi:MAG: hypothetical protein LBB43_03975, partial [Spirochaetaceae bacterium]|nr:hypothetical protein [Spirochaetaceae bacterium]
SSVRSALSGTARLLTDEEAYTAWDTMPKLRVCDYIRSGGRAGEWVGKEWEDKKADAPLSSPVAIPLYLP